MENALCYLNIKGLKFSDEMGSNLIPSVTLSI